MMMMTPAAMRVKNSAGTQSGETFGLGLGGGMRVTRFDFDLGMVSDVSGIFFETCAPCRT